MNSPKITVAVAVYKTKNEYLEECINSICNQTMEELDILLISDNTSEENLSLMRKYVKEDKRIRIIENKENQGLPGVRNQAIDNALGEYISFVDNDDWIDLDILAEVYRKAEIMKFPDIVAWTYTVHEENTDVKTNYIGPKEKLYIGLEKKHLQLQVLDPTYRNKTLQIPMFVTAWAKLYKVAFLRQHTDIRFPERLRFGGEDFPFTYRIVGAASSVLLVEEYGYYYRQHTESMTKKYDNTKWEKRCSWMEEVEKAIIKTDNEARYVFERFCLEQLLQQLVVTFNDTNCPYSFTEKWKQLKELVKEKHIQNALRELHELEFKRSKKIYYSCIKWKLYGLVLIFNTLFSVKRGKK